MLRERQHFGDPLVNMRRQEAARQRRQTLAQQFDDVDGLEQTLRGNRSRTAATSSSLTSSSASHSSASSLSSVSSSASSPVPAVSVSHRPRAPRPVYKGEPSFNRYNIRPGYRWDGRDRSNGWEQKRWQLLTQKRAREEDSYHYVTADM